jgi:hypothetical protein
MMGGLGMGRSRRVALPARRSAQQRPTVPPALPQPAPIEPAPKIETPDQIAERLLAQRLPSTPRRR